MTQSQDDVNIISQEGLEKIKAELAERKGETRDDIANKLEQAASQGDLSENAAYKAALEEKELNENKIAELEDIIGNSKVQKATKSSTTANIGATVTVERLDSGDKFSFKLVGKSEADPAQQLISIESPLGDAVFGQKKGDTVVAQLPTGEVQFKVVGIK